MWKWLELSDLPITFLFHSSNTVHARIPQALASDFEIVPQSTVRSDRMKGKVRDFPSPEKRSVCSFCLNAGNWLNLFLYLERRKVQEIEGYDESYEDWTQENDAQSFHRRKRRFLVDYKIFLLFHTMIVI